jgi:putative Holliday junction resolvase
MAVIKRYLGLDIGTKRIGLARADSDLRIAYPFDTLEVDGNEIDRLKKIVADEYIDLIVAGYPRNQQGNPTEQTRYTENYLSSIKNELPGIVYQDESLTSVMAEESLKTSGKTYSKGDIDAKAAAIILQDYLDSIHE